MAEPDEREVSPEVERLAAEYLGIYNRIAELEEQARLAKAALLAEIGDTDKYPDIAIGGQRIVYTIRRSARRPDAVSLMRAGIPVEQFSTVKPTLAAFWRMVERKGWNREWAEEEYIIDTGEVTRSISVHNDTTDDEE